MLHHIFQKVLLPAALAGTMLAGTAAPAVSLAAQAATQPDSYHDDWLHVNDNAEIVDKDGNPVWITGCNWFGYNVGSQVFDGVWVAEYARYAPADRRPRVQLSPDSHVHRDFAPMEKR